MRSPEERLQDILDAISSVEKYASLGRSRYDEDELVQTWILHHLQVIGEATSHLGGEFRSQYPDIPWAPIVAMRNILVHEYFGIDLDEIWLVVENDLPRLKRSLEE
jgi:uncharacterized protein with HEPN domain